MDEGSDLAALARYPFTGRAREHVSKMGLSLAEIGSHPLYSESLALARIRLLSAMERKGAPEEPSDSLGMELSILSYAIARILAHHTANRRVISGYASSEANRCYGLLRKDRAEGGEAYRWIAEDLGLGITGDTVHYTRYLELTAELARKDPRWRLVNRSLSKGRVAIDEGEKLSVIRELVYRKVAEPVDTSHIPDAFKKIAGEINGMYSLRPVEAGGEGGLKESALPPCIAALIAGLDAGITGHNQMFILATFLIGLGLSTDEIVKVFSRHPTFDEEKTRYQLEFLTGERGATRYSCPSCPKVKAYGLCKGNCDVNHPLNYYREKVFGVSKKKGAGKGKK